ncbi:MAG TPA: rod shape-determining protein RodA [Verrucomicrobiae bacterium]|jgi:rod shape determining protein RodA|nr:rod shape-determining protein RodA [Verrucomicrobiae bacterium]
MVRKWLKDTNWSLVVAMTALSIIGIIFIRSASYRDPAEYDVKQMVWASAGLVVFFLVPFVGYRRLLSVSYLLYVISLVLLVWVMVAGHTRLGAQRWIGIGPIIIQPSEFAKIATIMTLANFLGSHHSWEKKNSIILIALVLAFVPQILIMRQPDLGSSLLFVPMVIVLLFLWGIPYRYMIGAAVLGLSAVPILWSILKEYQKKRILVFLNPNLDPLGAGYTALQSKIAVGSGGLFGKGLLHGTQSQLQFVPEHHTDFIFCVLGEEWGYLGAALLLFCYAALFNAIFEVIGQTTDQRAKLLAAGILTVLFSQVMINVGMSIGLLPITGLTLPLISYGGSSFIMTALALGLVLSIHKERSIF